MIAEWIAGRYKRLAKANVSQSLDGNTLSWYGVELGHLVTDPVTKKRRGLAILNGDRFATGGWGNGGGRYQAETRAGLTLAGIPFVIVPFTACRAARIDVPTIRPVHVEPERYEVIHHRAADPPANMVIDPGHVPAASVRFGNDWLEPVGGVPVSDLVGSINQHGDLRWFTQAVLKREGMYEWYTNVHFLGDAVFTATVQSLNGRRNRRNVPFISSFDRQESRTLYFLSELPRTATDLEDALEALKPESVTTAESMGKVVCRQGDMFWICLEGVTRRDLRKLGAEFTRRKLTMTLRSYAQSQVAQRKQLEAIAVEVGPRPQRQQPGGVWEPYPDFSKREQEWRSKIADTYNARHTNGDRYRTISEWQVPAVLRYRPSRWDRDRDVEGEPLYGTAHTATEVATLPDGTQLARGCIFHEPTLIGERRPADHARRKLGDGRSWGVVVRNTVPLQRNR
ncbi:hypothetical protein AWB88_02810 [Mycobacterium paraense]|nr:hypothetical protein AWB88_02810 [Mycobacterium paraense]